MSATSAAMVDAFKIKFQQMIDEYGLTRDQVYNADETGLNYKALPTKTFASFSEKYTPGFKMQKQRDTIMVYANASGSHRLPLLTIGTAKKPQCFKCFNMNALPVQYYAQKSAWMNQTIFSDWFNDIFVPHVQQDLKFRNLPPKAILVLNNALSHPEQLQSDDGNITCYFLPANTTSLIQLMDQSVIGTLKRRYRKKFIQQLVSDENISIHDYRKSYNLKNVIDNVVDAWSDVSPDTLSRSWNKLWPIGQSS